MQPLTVPGSGCSSRQFDGCAKFSDLAETWERRNYDSWKLCIQPVVASGFFFKLCVTHGFPHLLINIIYRNPPNPSWSSCNWGRHSVCFRVCALHGFEVPEASFAGLRAPPVHTEDVTCINESYLDLNITDAAFFMHFFWKRYSVEHSIRHSRDILHLSRTFCWSSYATFFFRKRCLVEHSTRHSRDILQPSRTFCWSRFLSFQTSLKRYLWLRNLARVCNSQQRFRNLRSFDIYLWIMFSNFMGSYPIRISSLVLQRFLLLCSSPLCLDW